MNSQPLVSIVTISLNSEKYIIDTIKSVLAQTYKSFEYLIVDGGSTDRTLDIVRSFNDPRISIHIGKDDGIADAMNRGIRLSKGEIVGLIHSDDFYMPDAIEASLQQMRLHSARWSYGKIEYIDLDGSSLYTAGNPFNLKKIKKFMPLNHPSVFCAKRLYDELGVFDLKYRLAMDYDLCLRFALKEQPVFVPHVIAKMRVGGASSETRLAELRSAAEARLIKDTLVPNRIFSHWLYFCWQKIKINLRYLLKRHSIGKILISKLRRLANPNVAGN